MTAKLNMTDGIRGGITADEALTTARRLQDTGGVTLTAGAWSTDIVPRRRAGWQFAAAFKPPLRWGTGMTGQVFPRIPYRDAYLLREVIVSRRADNPADSAGRHHQPNDHGPGDARRVRVRRDGFTLPAEPDLVDRIAVEAGSQVVGVHTLQSVHGHDLSPHSSVVTGAP